MRKTQNRGEISHWNTAIYHLGRAPDNEWDPGDFGPWARNVILFHVAEAQQLREGPEKRWGARRCQNWPWKHAEGNVHVADAISRPETS